MRFGVFIPSHNHLINLIWGESVADALERKVSEKIILCKNVTVRSELGTQVAMKKIIPRYFLQRRRLLHVSNTPQMQFYSNILSCCLIMAHAPLVGIILTISFWEYVFLRVTIFIHFLVHSSQCY